MAFALTWIGLSALLTLLPGLGGRFVSPYLRVMLAGALAALATGVFTTGITTTSEFNTEIFASGFLALSVIALQIRAFHLTLHVSGTVLSQSLSMAHLFGMDAGSSSTLGQMLAWGGLALLATSGFFDFALVSLTESMFRLQASVAPAPEAQGEAAVSTIGSLLALAVVVCAPVLGGLVVFYMMLGVTNRVMPQLMIVFIALPAVFLLGLAATIAMIPTLLNTWFLAFGQAVERVL